jgi:hypothetical protein
MNKIQQLTNTLGVSRQRMSRIRKEGVRTKKAAQRLSGAVLLAFGEETKPEVFMFPETLGRDHWLFK